MIVSEGPRDNGFAWDRIHAIIRRRRRLLALSVLAGLAVGLIGYARTPRSYVSEAVVALDARRIALPSETVVSPLPQDSPVLRTELDLINSRSMAAKVVARLESEGVAIREEEKPGLSLSNVWRSLGSILPGAARAGDAVNKDTIPLDEREKAEILLSGLRVSNDGRSYTIFLTFSSSDPVFSAKVANAYAQAYLDHQIDVQRSATRRVASWLGETLVTLRAELEAAEQAAETFRQKAGLVETNGVTLQAQRVAALNSELAATRAAFADLEARLKTIQDLAAREQFPSLAEILGSPTVQSLRLEQARIERRLSELHDTKALKSPELTSLESELAATKRQIGEEITRIIASLTNEISVVHQKEESLNRALEKAQQALSEANHAEVTLAQLEREAAASRAIYESYLLRYKQTIEQDSIAVPEAQIISLAEPASLPAKPRLATWLMFGLGLGGSMGLAATFLREATDRRPRMIETLREATGVPVLGALPQLRDIHHLDEMVSDTSTAVGRAFSALRTALNLKGGRKPTSAIVVTSAEAGDGKTTLVLALARSAAAAGMRVIVVDANLRNPSVEESAHVIAGAYIDELLDGSKNVSEIIQEAGGYSIIAARPGAWCGAPLASSHLRSLVSELRLRFDVVLVDAPEGDAFCDLGDVTRFASRILFVVPFRTRRLDHVIASIHSLATNGNKPDGIVLNRVDRLNQDQVANQLLQVAARGAQGPRPIEADPVRQSA